MGNATATLPPHDEGSGPRCSIAHTERGWLLVIRDDESSVMQVFSSLDAARRATDRMYELFEDLHDDAAPPLPPAA
jgi:hypothetical protein